MHLYKGCAILFGIILNAFQGYGVLEINFPTNNVGIYKEITQMNCTETGFDVTNGYTWYKDSAVIYDTTNGDASGTGKYTSSHGTGYFTLEITNTALNDNGDYRCNYFFQDKSDTLEIQSKGSGEGKLEDAKLVLTLTEIYPNTTTVSSVKCNGKTFTGTSEVTDAGELFNLVWTSDASVDTSDLKNDCEVSMSSISPYVIVIAVDIGPTTSPTAPTTPPPTPSTTTKPPVVIIVSSVVGVFVIVIICIICIIVCKLLRRKSNRKKKYRADSENEEMPQVDINVIKQQ